MYTGILGAKPQNSGVHEFAGKYGRLSYAPMRAEIMEIGVPIGVGVYLCGSYFAQSWPRLTVDELERGATTR